MREALDPAEDRIREHRTADAHLRFLDRDGRPLANVRVHVRLASHELRLGCNAFRIGGIADAPLQRAYEERFADLLNYATLPFYGSLPVRRERAAGAGGHGERVIPMRIATSLHADFD